MQGVAQQEAYKVRVVGQGAPVLFFPGFTCTDEVWETQVAELSKTHQCHVFTFAGFGDVPAIEFPWYPKIEAAMESYVINNNLKEATVIGHSLGGTLALSLAAKNQFFKKLIIVDALTATGALLFPNFKSEDMVYESPFNQQMLAMNAQEFQGMAQGMAQGMTNNSEARQQIVDWMIAADRKTYVYGYTDYLKVDLREEVAKIKVPVVILAATQPYGAEMAKQTYEQQYKNLAEYQLHFAPDAAHFIMFDQPEWFLEQLHSNIN